MGVNDPSPTVACNRAGIAPRPASRAELVSDDFPVLHRFTLPLFVLRLAVCLNDSEREFSYARVRQLGPRSAEQRLD